MALTKPILYPTSAWDKNNGNTFYFDVVGGDAISGSRIFIRDNETNTLVDENGYEITSQEYRITIPSNASILSNLVNGNYYNAYIQTKANGNYSPNSNVIQFYCFTDPTWSIKINNEVPSAPQTITNSSVTVTLEYSQAETESLEDYIFNLYDSSNIQISTSGKIYTNSNSNTFIGSYSFFGLENGKEYSIEAIGHTSGGNTWISNKYEINVIYDQPLTYSVLIVNNNCSEGYITYYSNAIVIEGQSNDTPTYDTIKGVDLTQSSDWAKWEEGLTVTDNFTLKAWIYEPNINTTLIELSDDSNNKIKINYVYDFMNTNNVICTVEVYEGYFIYSNSIPIPSSDEMICIQLRRKNNLYDIVLGVV